MLGFGRVVLRPFCWFLAGLSNIVLACFSSSKVVIKNLKVKLMLLLHGTEKTGQMQ